jgi:hypothetical protein
MPFGGFVVTFVVIVDYRAGVRLPLHKGNAWGKKDTTIPFATLPRNSLFKQSGRAVCLAVQSASDEARI